MYVSLPIISIIVVAFGAFIAYLNFKKSGTKDNKQEATDNANIVKQEATTSAIISTKLDFITRGVDNIQLDIKSQNSRFDNISERVTRIEESTKQAHKRIDNIEYVKRKEVV